MSEQVTRIIDPADLLGVHAAVHAYVTRVRTALADLPSGEVEEIVEDINPHVSEVAAELGENITIEQLVGRLGTPESYAAELRAAAGYPVVGDESTGTAGDRILARLALWALIAASAAAATCGVVGARDLMWAVGVGTVVITALGLVPALPYLRRSSFSVPEIAALPEVAWLLRIIRRCTAGNAATRILSYLHSLQPAWWLARTVLVAVVFAGMFYRGRLVLIMCALLTIPFAAASVWLGRRAAGDRRLLWVVVPINAFALGLGMAAAINARINPKVVYTASGDSGDNYGLWSNGNRIRNVYVFDAHGKPIKDVYLYDQNGRELNVFDYACAHSNVVPEQPKNNVPKLVDQRPDWTCVVPQGVPFTVDIPQAHDETPTPSATPSASPSPSTQASPSASPTG